MSPGADKYAVHPIGLSKLCRPVVRGDYLVRPRLNALLTSGLACKLTVVVAPAGFGKTSLLAAWAARLDRPSAWLTLDEYDDDLSVFVRLLVAALRTVAPGQAAGTLSLLLQSAPPSVALLAATLGNELAELDQELVVVLDDYHLIRDPSVHDLLRAVLRYLPGHVHVVISAREDPPLLLGGLRVRGELHEIRAADLRFTESETRSLLDSLMGPEAGAAAPELQHRTEGWIAGLRLFAVADRSAASDPADAASRGSTQVRQYLLEQVLLCQPPDVQDFLLRTAILDRFCGELCDAIAPQESGAARGGPLLRRLEQENCFLLPLDEERVWYRHHQLFRDALRNELPVRFEARDLGLLHGRAAGWLASHGFLEEAIRHALAAGDHAQFARLVESLLDRCLDVEDWTALVSWVREIPRKVVWDHPVLLIAQAYSLHYGGRYAGFAPVLERVEALLAADSTQLEPRTLAMIRGTVAVFRAFAALGRLDPAISEHAREALEHLPASSSMARGQALVAQTIGAHWSGRGDLARETMRSELEAERRAEPAYRVRLFTALLYVETAMADLPRLQVTARQMLAYAEPRGLPSQVWAQFVLGLVHYEWDQLEQARAHFSAGICLRDRASAVTVRACRLGLALTEQAAGDAAAATEAGEAALESSEQNANQATHAEVNAALARLALAQGREDLAATHLRTIDTSPVRLPPWVVEAPAYACARLARRLGTPEALRAADRSLAEQIQIYRDLHDAWHVSQGLAHRALVAAQLGDRGRALGLLGQAVALAAPGRLLRTFLDLGSPAQELLRDLVLEPDGPDYAETLLEAFASAAEASPDPQPEALVAQPGLVERLTWRELQILRLLAARLTNKEIGEALVISTETVKKHAANIYGKLEVGGRREAVARAEALGLLADDLTSRGA